MAKLTSDQREEVSTLLSEYEFVTDAISRLSEETAKFSAIVTDEEDDDDFVEVHLNEIVAEAALTAQRNILVDQLLVLGIEVE